MHNGLAMIVRFFLRILIKNRVWGLQTSLYNDKYVKNVENL